MASYQLAKFGGHKHCGSGDMNFRLSRDLTRPPD